MSWYRAGTAAFTNGSTTVGGTSTAWASNVKAGEGMLAPDGRFYEVMNVASDTSMTIQPAYAGTTASGQAYAIAPTYSYIRDLATQAALLLNKYATLANNFLIDANGNAGLGVSPFAWRGSEKSIDVGATASFAYYGGALIANNAYIGSSGWLAKTTGVAQNLQINAAGLQLQQAASTTAGSAPAWVTSFAIDAPGNIGHGAQPAPWGAGWKSFDNTYGSGLFSGSSNVAGLATNLYNDGSTWRMRTNALPALMYLQDFGTGKHQWFTSVAGVGGGTASLVKLMELDASGNIGLGIVGSAWGPAQRALEMQGGAAFMTSGVTYAAMTQNMYYDGTNWRLKGAAAGSYYEQSSGAHAWWVAASGAAGSVPTLVRAMALDAAGNLLLTGGGGLGYGPGSGGTVAQGAGSGKATAVTLNKLSGQITMNAQALAAGAVATFQVNNSAIGDNDVVSVNGMVTAVDPRGKYRIEVAASGSGFATIMVTNISAGSLSEAVALKFVVIKGSST